jgi:3-methyladenine DNA glycosylase/8-oxoguanine DNA glycosylase
MRAGETELEMCARHVAEQKNSIARQEALIERLRESRSDVLDDALRLLPQCRTSWRRCALI